MLYRMHRGLCIPGAPTLSGQYLNKSLEGNDLMTSHCLNPLARRYHPYIWQRRRQHLPPLPEQWETFTGNRTHTLGADHHHPCTLHSSLVEHDLTDTSFLASQTQSTNILCKRPQLTRDTIEQQPYRRCPVPMKLTLLDHVVPPVLPQKRRLLGCAGYRRATGPAAGQ